MAYTGYAQVDTPPGGTPGGERPTTTSPTTPTAPPPNPQLQSLMNLYQQAVIGPTQAIAGQQTGNLQDQMALLMAGGDLQSQLAQQQAGFSLQGLGLQGQQQDINRDALARQLVLAQQQHGLAGQGMDISQGQAQLGADISRRSLDSSETARGAYTSVGANQRRGDIAQQLQYSLDSLGLQRQGENLSYNERLAQNADANKQLNLSSKQLGIQGDEIKARLQNALNQIGIGSQMSVDQLLSEMYKVQQGEISPISGLFGDIYSLSGVTMPNGQGPLVTAGSATGQAGGGA